MGRFFRFDHEWTLPAGVGAAYDVLVDLEWYPRWWPQVSAVGKLDDDRALVVCRSFLPYSLTLQLTAHERDRDGGRLCVDIDGDLEGWSRFTLTELSPTAPDAAGERRTRLCYEQEVVARARMLSVAPRAVVGANHAWMMRGARIGLTSEVGRRAGGRRGAD